MVNIGHICMAKKRDWTRMYVGYFAYSLGQTWIRWRRCVNMKKYKMLFICIRNLVSMQNTPYHAQWTPIIKCRKNKIFKKNFQCSTLSSFKRGRWFLNLISLFFNMHDHDCMGLPIRMILLKIITLC